MTTETTDPLATEPAHELEAAYVRGDFAQLQKRARELAADASASDSLQKLARDWQARVSVDVAVYAMLAFAFALFCAIVMRYALP